MTNIQKAIQKAIEGGYVKKSYGLLFDLNNLSEIHKKWSDASRIPSTDRENLSLSAGYGEGFRDCAILLDPLFWSSLGKSLGWSIVVVCSNCGNGARKETAKLTNSCLDCGCRYKGNLWRSEQEYLFNWHRFINHLHSGKDPESFFISLLTNK